MVSEEIGKEEMLLLQKSSFIDIYKQLIKLLKSLNLQNAFNNDSCAKFLSPTNLQTLTTRNARDISNCLQHIIKLRIIECSASFINLQRLTISGYSIN